jgi:two-component SAPR family response regulator
VEFPSRYRRACEVGAAIVIMPPGEASGQRLAALFWPNATLEGGLHNVEVNVSHLRGVWRTILGEAGRQVVRSEDGCYVWNTDLVAVDLYEFVDAVRAGNAARQGRAAEAIAAYRRARTQYAGELLAGSNSSWLEQRLTARGLTLRELHRQRERRATESLAKLLVEAREYAEAAALLEELIQEPGPPDGRRTDQERLEVFGLDLFRCYAGLADRRRLVEARERLCQALAAIDRAAGVVPRSKPSAAAESVYDRLLAAQTESGAMVAD